MSGGEYLLSGVFDIGGGDADRGDAREKGRLCVFARRLWRGDGKRQRAAVEGLLLKLSCIGGSYEGIY